MSSPNVWQFNSIGAYGYNHWFLAWGGQKRGIFDPITAGQSYVNLGMISHPSETICFLDYIDMNVYPAPLGDPRVMAEFGARHHKGWNVGMVDGRVRWHAYPSEVDRYTWLWDLD